MHSSGVSLFSSFLYQRDMGTAAGVPLTLIIACQVDKDNLHEENTVSV